MAIIGIGGDHKLGKSKPLSVRLATKRERAGRTPVVTSIQWQFVNWKNKLAKHLGVMLT
jgi:hypothetical protein